MKSAQFAPRGGIAALAIGIIGFVAPCQADLITNNPNLPPDGVYLSPDQVHAMYTGGALTIVLTAVQHQPFANETQRQAVGPNEIETFPSSMAGLVSVNNSPAVPASGMGPVQTMVLGKVGNVTGTFDTEMLSMSIAGTSPFGPFMIRESPTLPSLGETTITDLGGGFYNIDSFFDVFTELSLDGGANWIPDSVGPTRVVLVPEPSSIGLLGIGLASLLGFGRRRRD